MVLYYYYLEDINFRNFFYIKNIDISIYIFKFLDID